ARLGRRSPISVRLALRDLSRYRARSGSALAAISIGILIAVIISVTAAARFGNVLDYAGPNLASNQLIVYTPNGQGGGPNGPANPAQPRCKSATAASRTVRGRTRTRSPARGAVAWPAPRSRRSARCRPARRRPTR